MLSSAATAGQNIKSRCHSLKWFYAQSAQSLICYTWIAYNLYCSVRVCIKLWNHPVDCKQLYKCKITVVIEIPSDLNWWTIHILIFKICNSCYIFRIWAQQTPPLAEGIIVKNLQYYVSPRLFFTYLILIGKMMKSLFWIFAVECHYFKAVKEITSKRRRNWINPSQSHPKEQFSSDTAIYNFQNV